MKFSIKDFFSKCEQIRSFLRIWSHLLKKSIMENFIFCSDVFKKHIQSTFAMKCFRIKFGEENTMHCSNRDDFLQLSFTLKISIFSEAYYITQSKIYDRAFIEKIVSR